MTKSYDMSSKRMEIKEIQQSLEKKKESLAQLEDQKQKLLDAVTSIEGAKIDDEVKQVAHDSINDAIEANRNKGKELSSEMGQEITKMEEIKQETFESESDVQNKRNELNRKRQLLNRFGLGGVLDKAVNRLDSNVSELEEIKDDAINTMRELEKTSQKAGSL